MIQTSSNVILSAYCSVSCYAGVTILNGLYVHKPLLFMDAKVWYIIVEYINVIC
jgi:hypothetical protein